MRKLFVFILPFLFATALVAQTDSSQIPKLLWSRGRQVDIPQGRFSHNEQYCAVWELGKLQIYALPSYEVIASFDSAMHDATNCAFDPSDTLFYYLSIKKYPTESRHTIQRPIADTAGSRAGWFNTDSIQVDPGEVILHRWSIPSRKEISQFAIDFYRGSFGFASNAKRLYETDVDSFIRVIDVQTGKQLSASGVRQSPRYSDGCFAAGPFAEFPFLIESANAKYAAIKFSDYGLGIIQNAPFKVLWRWGGYKSRTPVAIAFHKDSALILCEDSLIVFDLVHRRELRREGHPFFRSGLAISETTFVCIPWSRRGLADTLLMYNADRNTLHREIPIHPSLNFVQYLPKSQRLMMNSQAFSEVYNIATHDRDTVRVGNQSIDNIFFSKAANVIITKQYAPKWIEYDSRNGAVRDMQSYSGFDILAMSNDGKSYVVVHRDTLYLKDAVTDQEHPVGLRCSYGCDVIGFSPTGKWIVIRRRDGQHPESIQLLDTRDKSGDAFLYKLPSWGQARIFPDERRAVFYGNDTLRIQSIGFSGIEQLLIGHAGRVSDAAISADGEWLASRVEAGTVFLWRVRDGAIKGVFRTGWQSHEMQFSPNNRYLLYRNEKGIIPIDMHTGEKLPPVVVSDLNITSFAFSEDGEEFAVGDGTGKVSVWESPRSWVIKEEHPIDLKTSYLPLRFFTPKDARPVVNKDGSVNQSLTDVNMEVLDKDRKRVVKLIDDQKLGKGVMHIWEWDATNQPKGTYYMHVTIGGVEHEEAFELK